MSKNFNDLRAIEFMTLSEAKAKFSEVLRNLSSEKRIAVTNDGRPAAVILSYQDYSSLLDLIQPSREESSETVIKLSDWEKERPRRERVRESVLSLFDVDQLSRKGRKNYKKEKLDEFQRKPS